MGKIRINTIGDESLEKKQQQRAEKRREAKGVAKGKVENSSAGVTQVEGLPEARTPLAEGAGGALTGGKPGAGPQAPKKVVKKKQFVTKVRSPKYTENAKLRDKNKTYNLSEALNILEKMKKSQFDETVELHINTIETGVSGSLLLPHGTGKKMRVVIVSPSKDAKAADDVIKQIEAGKINFDILVATPDAMPRLAKVARILGPKGLMPNPKAGTVTPKPEEVAKKYEAGQLNYKTEAKAPVIHATIGKTSFGKSKLTDNITAFLATIDNSKIKSVFLKSTMSPSLRISK